MTMKTLALALVSLTACFEQDDGAIIGPFTGPVHRFVVDDLALPFNNNEAREMARDLSGDRVPDNQLGMVVGTLHNMDAAQAYTRELLAAGAIAMTVEIQADDLQTDDSVGVWWYGDAGASARAVGGKIVDGVFLPNEVATTFPENHGRAIVRLPVFQDTDASTVELVSMQIQLVPDGRGGYEARIQGTIRQPEVIAATQDGILDLLAARPDLHRTMRELIDKDDNGVTREEIANNSLIRALLAPDLPDDLLSVGFRAHLTPCAEGRCTTAAVAQPCFDRVLDGDETDVDCGGACFGCAAGEVCVTDADCQSGTCASGTCTEPTCSDGIKNGFEADLDCGGWCEQKCTGGARCGFDFDCERGCDGTRCIGP